MDFRNTVCVVFSIILDAFILGKCPLIQGFLNVVHGLLLVNKLLFLVALNYS